jgi:hypothetical protein
MLKIMCENRCVKSWESMTVWQMLKKCIKTWERKSKPEKVYQNAKKFVETWESITKCTKNRASSTKCSKVNQIWKSVQKSVNTVKIWKNCLYTIVYIKCAKR